MSRSQLTWEGGPGIVFDALLSESLTYTSDVPTAPTERGYVADTVTRRPLALRVEVSVSDVSVHNETARPGRVGQVRGQLLTLQANGTLVTLLTPGGLYRDMVVQSVTWTRDALPTTWVFTLALVETRIATTATAQASRLPSQATGRGKRVPEAEPKAQDGAKRPPKDSFVLGFDGVRDGLGALGLPQ